MFVNNVATAITIKILWHMLSPLHLPVRLGDPAKMSTNEVSITFHVVTVLTVALQNSRETGSANDC